MPGYSSEEFYRQRMARLKTEIVRLGVSYWSSCAALHKDIRMTLRPVQVTLRDLRREFHPGPPEGGPSASHAYASPFPGPSHSRVFPVRPSGCDTPGPETCCRQLEATRKPNVSCNFVRMRHEQGNFPLRRLDQRLLAVASQLARIATGEK